MLLEQPTFVANDLPTLTFVTVPKLSTKKPRVWVSGLLHTHQGLQDTAFFLHPSQSLCPCPMLSEFPVTSKPCNKSNDSCSLSREKGHWANEFLNKACFALKPHSDTAKPNILNVEIHLGTADATKKDEENSKQTRKLEIYSSNRHRVHQACQASYWCS